LTSFADLGLAAPILKALESEGYVTPTPIQAKAIPPVLAGRDLLGIAQTGTGKTAAFALPIIDRLARTTKPRKPKSCRALVLSPTRELATQIAESFRAYARNTGLTVTTVFGGVSERPQITALARGVDIVVATPGRLLDHIHQRNISFADTEVFVLDEADQMLDLGFLPPIRRIVGHLPKQRQNLFFSATMPADIGRLADDLLRDPVKVAVTPVASTVDRVSQRVIHVESHKKRALLVELFADPEVSRALVFTRTKRGADRVARHLEAAGVGVASIHGNKSQAQREKALEAFRSARIRALVATDIAARGIDVDQVSHVVNYELPDVPEAYVHRIGRTARAGHAGVAISLCDAEERDQLRDIERLTRQSIAAEDRRNDKGLGGDAPQAREARGGDRHRARQESGWRFGRPSEDRRGTARSHPAPAPRNGHSHGEKRASGPHGNHGGRNSGQVAGSKRSNGDRPAAPHRNDGGTGLAGVAFFHRPAARTGRPPARATGQRSHRQGRAGPR
jgi:ATP-dependent RNA helicase RhlE